MAVPLLDLKVHHEPLKKEILAVLERTFQSNAFILGPDVAKLEERIAAYCQANHGIGVTSGTDALLLALKIGRAQGMKLSQRPIHFLPLPESSSGLEPSRCWSILNPVLTISTLPGSAMQ